MAERSTTERECGCPLYVVMCVHYKAQVVVMISPDAAEAEFKRRGRPMTTERFWGAYGPGSWADSLDDPDSIGLLSSFPGSRYLESATQARAEFARRAELLRRGGGGG